MRIFSSPPESGGVRGGLRSAFLRPLRGTSATAKRKVIKVVIHPNFKNAGSVESLFCNDTEVLVAGDDIVLVKFNLELGIIGPYR